MVLDWRKRQQSRAAVRISIEKTLDLLPRICTPNIFQNKCDLVYQHVHDSYFGLDKVLMLLLIEAQVNEFAL